MTALEAIEPSTLPVPLSALRRCTGTSRVLALHGWLDNALSFAPLAAELTGTDLVCLEFPGHGGAASRPPAARYHFDDYVFDVLAAADALGWDRFHLLGHSLGGAVASVLSAACPERVTSLTVIEGLGPLTAEADQTAAGWRRAVQASQHRPRRVHDSRDRAIEARMRDSDLSPEAAEQLAARGLEPVDGGWRWRHDLRLTWPSTQRYTEAQVLDLLAHIEAPTLCVLSEPPSRVVPVGLIEQRLAAVPRLVVERLAGGHHLHMQQPGPIARMIRRHLDACERED
ncbi:MAG: alpha/beta fold hydrolase [Wenzhouxiangellaceae bacterium]|nr:alpha/beta fold hydrolase [Wenzhouxiangellaceae bacterium]